VTSAALRVRFSVIVPAFNAAETLPETVASALGQRGTSLEVIISDDGSTDDTLAVARELAQGDDRVRVVAHSNGGCSEARNRAFEVATGEFCVLLDSDDLLGPDYLDRMTAFIETNPGFEIYSCNGTRRFATGREEPFFAGAAYAKETSWTLDDLIPVDRIFVMAVVRRDLWQRIGGFRTDLRYAEDYDFWLRALAAGATHRYLPERLATAVFRAGSKSKSLIAHAHAQLTIFADLADDPRLTAAQRQLCAAKIESLRLRIRRVELEARLQRGEYAGARREYLAVRGAYLSQRAYLAGLALMLASPRAYADAFARRAQSKARS
jgi:GT2 family glycosyltransferase